MSDFDDEYPKKGEITRLDSNPAFQQKPNKEAPKDDVDQDQSTDDYKLKSSSDAYQRLKPYFDNIITQLKISFDSYVLPDDIYFKLAEAYNIRNRGDVFTTELLLIIGKLQPLIAKKTGVRWAIIEKNAILPLLKKYRAEHYASNLYRLDTIPENEWFYKDAPTSSGMDILLAMRRMKCEIRYDEWLDVCQVSYNNEIMNSLKLDEIYYILAEQFTYHFKFRIEKKQHVMEALGILRRNNVNVFNSRRDWADEFLQFYDPIRDKDWDWITEITEALHCGVNEYTREIARALFISPLERTYRPGCDLQHMIILDDPKGGKGKSTLARILAGNPTLDTRATTYFTDKNIFTIKNDVTRYTETKGKAVHEYAEMAGQSRLDLEHMKNVITSTVESCRPLFSMDLLERPRWFYSMGTTNRGEYNYETNNRRYLGLRVSIDGKMIDNVGIIKDYNKIMGCLVWNVKNGMSGAIDKKVKDAATYQQDIRIVENDLSLILKYAFAFAHLIDDDALPGVKRERMLERYQIGFKDIRDGDKKIIQRMYKISLKGLSTYAADYIDFYKRKVNIDVSAIKSTILKVMVVVDCYVNDNDEIITYKAAPRDENDNVDESQLRHHPVYYKWEHRDHPERMPKLYNPIKGYGLTIDAPHIAKFEELAYEYILELQEFIETKAGLHITNQQRSPPLRVV
jgi:Virulence-associated protein E